MFHCSGNALVMRFGHQLADFARLRVAPQPGFLEYGRPVHHDFEPAPTRRDQIDGRRRIALPEFSRQTGGSWLVVSNGAVFDLDVHRNHSVRVRSLGHQRHPMQSVHRVAIKRCREKRFDDRPRTATARSDVTQ